MSVGWTEQKFPGGGIWRCLIEMRQSGGVFAWGGCKLIGGVHREFGLKDARDADGCDCSCSNCGCTGEEAATCSLVILEGLLWSDVGGTNISVETAGLAEEH